MVSWFPEKKLVALLTLINLNSDSVGEARVLNPPNRPDRTDRASRSNRSNRVKTELATDSHRFKTGKALKSGGMGGGTWSDGVIGDVLFAARMAAGSGTELTADPLEFVRTSESISYALRESISRTETYRTHSSRFGVHSRQ